MKVKKKLDKKNKTKELHVLFLILVISILSIIVLFIIDKGKFDYWKIYIPLTGTGLLGLGTKLFTWFIESNTIRFGSIKEEMFYYNDNFPNDAHYVLSVLNSTKTDGFVLAYFKKRHEIRPAVYTVRGKRITYLNLRIQETFFKKIYPNEDDLEKYVRAYRIKNKSTNSQMLFFASDIKSLEIQINNQSVPIMYSDDKIGNFSVYGITEPTDGTLSNSVNINGCDYPLIETPVNSYFINTSEI